PVRDALGYPPARRLLRLMVTGRRLGDVEAAAADLAGALRATLVRPGLDLLGPAPAVFPRLQDRHRVQLLVKGALRPAERAWLADCLRALREGRRGIDIVHDVDPVSVA
ncbi:MAG TPA: primosomal protein N', partial [Candidatus Krumholzibacteria bacterium]|nr:primosomal protein N' [Candidatus Krumholzibacteria bacterium]